MATYGPPPGTELKVHSTTFQPAQNLMIYDSGTWKQVTEGHVYVGGSNPWRKIWGEVAGLTPYTTSTISQYDNPNNADFYGFSVASTAPQVFKGVATTSGQHKIVALYAIYNGAGINYISLILSGSYYGTEQDLLGSTLNIYFHGDGSTISIANWYTGYTTSGQWVNNKRRTTYNVNNTTQTETSLDFQNNQLRDKLIANLSNGISVYLTSNIWPAPTL